MISTDRIRQAPLYEINYIFLIVIKILSLALIIDGLTTMCLSEFSPGLYLYGDA